MRNVLLIGLILAMIGCAPPKPIDGKDGVAGQNGSNGHSAIMSQVAAGLDVCPNGGTAISMGVDTNDDSILQVSEVKQLSIVCNGLNGQAGATGPQGPQGTTGAAGTNATPVTAVQFCAGYITTYPSSFPEFGVCMNGEIYAVYWDNRNAWLAKVVPGYYMSTSTSAPCDFEVKTNCRIGAL